MSKLLMPNTTAIWLIDNTALSFDQIGDFCGLHRLEVQALADGEVHAGMKGMDPVLSGQLTADEIARCEADESLRLALSKDVPAESKTKERRYTPFAKRAHRPDAIAWCLKNTPELSDSQLAKLIGTTRTTIVAVRDRHHHSIGSLNPRSPVDLGLCNAADFEKALALAAKNASAQTSPEEPDTAPKGAEKKSTSSRCCATLRL